MRNTTRIISESFEKNYTYDENSKKFNRSKKGNKKAVQEKEKDFSSLPEDDNENQGFSDWLRSSSGIEMMKLFVISNSIMIVVTMAWPAIQEVTNIIYEWIYGEEDI